MYLLSHFFIQLLIYISMGSWVIISLCFIIQCYHYLLCCQIVLASVIKNSFRLVPASHSFLRSFLLSRNKIFSRLTLCITALFSFHLRCLKSPSILKKIICVFLVSSPLGDSLYEVMLHFICPKLLFPSCKSF